MITETLEKGKIRSNTNGRPGHIFEYDFGRQIGINSAGKPATKLRLIRHSNGAVWTAFPY